MENHEGKWLGKRSENQKVSLGYNDFGLTIKCHMEDTKLAAEVS